MDDGHTKFHPDWHFGLWKVNTLNYITVQNRKSVTMRFIHTFRLKLVQRHVECTLIINICILNVLNRARTQSRAHTHTELWF